MPDGSSGIHPDRADGGRGHHGGAGGHRHAVFLELSGTRQGCRRHRGHTKYPSGDRKFLHRQQRLSQQFGRYRDGQLA
ncbi:hypothetical protein DESC_710044 [Desulfosarcina cetonica]|nr:hypothetical protein DESC_710044 [Desulfosarcina cetonica]